MKINPLAFVFGFVLCVAGAIVATKYDLPTIPAFTVAALIGLAGSAFASGVKVKDREP
jgi:ABC-type Mn2+/Zn2+ transport system permease subunit